MDWQRQIQKFIKNISLRSEIVNNSLNLVDGIGVKRTVKELLS